MHPRTRELLDQLDTQHAAMRAAIDSVPRELRERRPSTGGWSVAEILEHMTRVTERLTTVMQRMLEQARASGVGDDLETGSVLDPRFTAMLADRGRRVEAGGASLPTGTLDAESAWSALDVQVQALRSAIAAGDGLALGQVSLPHPAFGPLSWYGWAQFASGHEGRHAAQVRDIAQHIVGEY